MSAFSSELKGLVKQLSQLVAASRSDDAARIPAIETVILLRSMATPANMKSARESWSVTDTRYGKVNKRGLNNDGTRKRTYIFMLIAGTDTLCVVYYCKVCLWY
ncbi:hypothetical protein [Enterobacter cloacae]|uniref:hypothetical protein n=1 Tax=Enterobacter cloacae TaxID=550 RepID=UPI00388D4ADB